MNCCSSQLATGIHDQSVSDFSRSPEEQEFRQNSNVLDNGLFQTEIVVPSIHCVVCISKIEKSLSALPHVVEVRVNLSLRRANIIWDGKKGKGTSFPLMLDQLGFENFLLSEEDETTKRLAKEGKSLLLALAVSGFAVANIMLLSISVWSGADGETAKLFHLISGLIAVPAVAIGGKPFFASAVKALFAKRLNMDVPISLAVLLALGMGLYETFNSGEEAYFDACVMLLFFLLIGRYLDHLMRQKARSSVESLSKITSKGGILLAEDGSTSYIDLNKISIGQVLRIYPGERFPVDGIIQTGASDLDRSLVTGESISVTALVGDNIEAGVLNLTGPVDIVATSDAKTSFTAEIMKMMNAAENGRGRYVRIAERAAAIYAPAVHVLALATFVLWMIITSGDWRMSLYAAIAVLIITCPCALGLAVPVVHVIGANRLLKEGIFMRDGSAFERLAEINIVAFDKTGTLTSGMPQLVNDEFPNKRSAKIIAALASQTSHPIAGVLKRKFSSFDKAKIKNVQELAGFGVEATYNDKTVRLGRPSWVAEISSENYDRDENASVAFCESGQETISYELVDTLRKDAKTSVESLKNNGLVSTILSGDRDGAVEKTAQTVGINSFYSELKPFDKIVQLDVLKEAGNKVLMVGDGLNDAPALTSAYVSMAPSTASEVGRLASDIVFTRASLLAVPFAWQIAVETKKLIQQNFAIAIVYNCIAVPLAVAGFVTPLIAAIAMSASSILVVGNSLRLNFTKAASKQDDDDASEQQDANKLVAASA